MPSTRAQAVWLVAVQVAALGLTALALNYTEAPAAPQRQLLALLAFALLVVALVPGWRRGHIAGILGGITCALACWLSSARTFELDDPGDLGFIAGYVPIITPIIVGVVVVLIIWGVLTRSGLRDDSRFGIAALVGSALVGHSRRHVLPAD